MSSVLRSAAVVVLSLAFAAPCFAQPNAKPLPEPLPMGIPYYYQPGNPYWYAPAFPFPSPYPYGALTPVYGRYAWDYTGQFVGHSYYPYAYYYPAIYGRVWVVR